MRPQEFFPSPLGVVLMTLAVNIPVALGSHCANAGLANPLSKAPIALLVVLVVRLEFVTARALTIFHDRGGKLHVSTIGAGSV